MKKLSIALLVIGCGILVTACGQESAAQKAVLSGLKDPDSAKFGKSSFIKNAKGSSFACVTVNSKNSMGGYVGDKQALLMEVKDSWTVFGFEDISHDQCLSIVAAM
jgi:hypothetical protein